MKLKTLHLAYLVAATTIFASGFSSANQKQLPQPQSHATEKPAKVTGRNPQTGKAIKTKVRGQFGEVSLGTR